MIQAPILRLQTQAAILHPHAAAAQAAAPGTMLITSRFRCTSRLPQMAPAHPCVALARPSHPFQAPAVQHFPCWTSTSACPLPSITWIPLQPAVQQPPTTQTRALRQSARLQARTAQQTACAQMHSLNRGSASRPPTRCRSCSARL